MAYNAFNVTEVQPLLVPDHMRVFFNAGGTLNVRGTIGPGGGTLNNDWRNLMNAVGTVKMGRSSTSNGSVGTNYGYANLSCYVTIFNKAVPAYSANDYPVEAKKNASPQLISHNI